jgi:hypothetical protein
VRKGLALRWLVDWRMARAGSGVGQGGGGISWGAVRWLLQKQGGGDSLVRGPQEYIILYRTLVHIFVQKHHHPSTAGTSGLTHEDDAMDDSRQF